jgi:hypothetical protein
MAPAAALALSAALGCQLTVLVSRPWASVTFSGEKVFLAVEGTLPANLDEVDVAIAGGVLADIASLGDDRLEVLLIADA